MGARSIFCRGGGGQAQNSSHENKKGPIKKKARIKLAKKTPHGEKGPHKEKNEAKRPTYSGNFFLLLFSRGEERALTLVPLRALGHMCSAGPRVKKNVSNNYCIV